MTIQTDLEQVDAANASGRPPVVFVHGLWLLPGSWQRWAAVFGAAHDHTRQPNRPLVAQRYHSVDG